MGKAELELLVGQLLAMQSITFIPEETQPTL
jgi:hypothetical protein